MRTRITGLLTCGATVLVFVCMRFAATVLQRMLGVAVGGYADLPRLAAFALTLTGYSVLVPLLLICVAAVIVSEATIQNGANRLLVQGAVLLVLVIVLAVCLAGFFISFYIPEVSID